MNKYVEEARKEDPEGCTCGFCGEENDHADDCGWFFASIEPLHTNMPNCHGIPVCKSCWRNGIGSLHIELHGLGDR